MKKLPLILLTVYIVGLAAHAFFMAGTPKPPQMAGALWPPDLGWVILASVLLPALLGYAVGRMDGDE